MDCFAYDKKKTKGGEAFFCAAMETEVCQGKACPFYKPKKQAEKERLRALERLRSLPEEQQKKIRDKYGLGKF